MVQNQPRHIVQETPISKITTAKWTGGVSQVVQHRLCKFKAPIPPKKKNNNRVFFFIATENGDKSQYNVK
jgi:hypothetical protein